MPEITPGSASRTIYGVLGIELECIEFKDLNSFIISSALSSLICSIVSTYSIFNTVHRFLTCYLYLVLSYLLLFMLSLTELTFHTIIMLKQGSNWLWK